MPRRGISGGTHDQARIHPRQQTAVQGALRQLHRRPVRRAGRGAVFREHLAGERPGLCEIARSGAEDIEAALDAAHAAKEAWGRTSAAERAMILNRIAQRMEDNLDLLAAAETWDNGKPIRETTAADLPLAIDYFRYFAGAIRAQEGGISEIDADTVAYHFHEPLGVVG
jgi:aldehyde dehydrogenase